MLVTLIVLSLGMLMLIVERLRPGRAWPTVRNWWVRAIALNLAQVSTVFLAGYVWNGWMVQRRPWSADRLGLVGGALAGYLVITFIYIAELFYHWNVKTPHWLGYFIQRPESHLIHHQDGLHAYNYADLPLWDICFGTFRNPRAWNERCGFGDDELRVSEMLLGRDVSR